MIHRKHSYGFLYVFYMEEIGQYKHFRQIFSFVSNCWLQEKKRKYFLKKLLQYAKSQTNCIREILMPYCSLLCPFPRKSYFTCCVGSIFQISLGTDHQGKLLGIWRAYLMQFFRETENWESRCDSMQSVFRENQKWI